MTANHKIIFDFPVFKGLRLVTSTVATFSHLPYKTLNSIFHYIKTDIFPLRFSSVNWKRPQKTADMFIFTREILHGKLHFLGSAYESFILLKLEKEPTSIKQKLFTMLWNDIPFFAKSQHINRKKSTCIIIFQKIMWEEVLLYQYS